MHAKMLDLVIKFEPTSTGHIGWEPFALTAALVVIFAVVVTVILNRKR